MRTSVPLTEQQRKAMCCTKKKSGNYTESIGLVQGQHTE
jgi:hypothetical protein